MTAAATTEARRDAAILRQAGSGLARAPPRAGAGSFVPVSFWPTIATIVSDVARACSAGMATSLPVVAVACCSCSLVLLLLELAVSGSGCLPGMGIARPARGPRAGNGPAPSHSTPGWPQTPDHPLCYVENMLRGV